MENWKPIAGFEGIYEVSDLGRARSLDRIVLKRCGQGRNPNQMVPHTVRGVILKPCCGDRYYNVALSRHTINLHTLVLTTFRGPCPPGKEACHNDSDTSNNKLDNLRWDSPASNAEDRRVRGTLARGERHGRAILNERDVIFIVGSVVPARHLAHKFGVSSTAILRARNKQSWKYLWE